MEKNTTHRLDIARLIEDLGGPAALAKAIGVTRTTPYRWRKRNYLSSPVLEKIKDAFPGFVIDKYFINGEADGEQRV